MAAVPSLQFALVFTAENTCPIDFPELPVLKEFQETSLICSTLSQCPFHPQIQGVTQLPESWQENGKKISSVKYEAAWQDNGKEIRCQTPDNTDQHLVKKFNLTVECKCKMLQKR